MAKFDFEVNQPELSFKAAGLLHFLGFRVGVHFKNTDFLNSASTQFCELRSSKEPKEYFVAFHKWLHHLIFRDLFNKVLNNRKDQTSYCLYKRSENDRSCLSDLLSIDEAIGILEQSITGLKLYRDNLKLENADKEIV
jgi:hypothetical protein